VGSGNRKKGFLRKTAAQPPVSVALNWWLALDPRLIIRSKENRNNERSKRV